MTSPAEKPKCFIIMPISTPTDLANQYNNDINHFEHVFECLFKPAVEDAGFEAIDPRAYGSENIQARIIKYLEIADLVFCDMSTLNANVFFEYGIRTALNKPVCVVHDEHCTIPFDTKTVNSKKYSSNLASYITIKEVPKIKEHINATVSLGNENPLWKHFGLSSRAHSVTENGTDNDQLAYIINLLEEDKRKPYESYSTIRNAKALKRGVLVDGSILKEVRESKGLTQIDLKSLCGYNERTIRRVESGEPVSARTVRDIAESMHFKFPFEDSVTQADEE